MPRLVSSGNLWNDRMAAGFNSRSFRIADDRLAAKDSRKVGASMGTISGGGRRVNETEEVGLYDRENCYTAALASLHLCRFLACLSDA